MSEEEDALSNADSSLKASQKVIAVSSDEDETYDSTVEFVPDVGSGALLALASSPPRQPAPSGAAALHTSLSRSSARSNAAATPAASSANSNSRADNLAGSGGGAREEGAGRLHSAKGKEEASAEANSNLGDEEAFDADNAPTSPGSLRKWQQFQRKRVAEERRFSIGTKQAQAFIRELRRNQRRNTMSEGQNVQENIWSAHEGFREFYESGRFSDLTLVCQNKEFEVHRLVLSYSSGFFEELLRDPETSDPVHLSFPDPDNVFPDIIRFMYTGDIHVTAEKAVPLLAMADHYDIRELKGAISVFISSSVRRENAITLLRKALQFHADKIVSRCIHVVANNFAYVYGTSFNFLPYPLFLKLIRHRYLNVVEEYELFRHVKSYIAAHPSLTAEQVNRLLQSVRYRWFELDQLIDVARRENAPQELLVEAVLHRLREHEPVEGASSDEASDTPSNVRLQRRPLYPITIRFEPCESGVPPGIINWIARRDGRQEWENPHLMGLLTVSASSLEKGRLLDLVSNAESELWTKDVPASWFSIDFGQSRSVLPSHYTLRHGGNYRGDSIRNWNLEGSINGVVWEVLRSHKNDSSLSKPFAIASWPLVDVKRPYRYFRVIQTGHNSSTHNFLVLSNLELYGNLFTLPTKEP